MMRKIQHDVRIETDLSVFTPDQYRVVCSCGWKSSWQTARLAAKEIAVGHIKHAQMTAAARPAAGARPDGEGGVMAWKYRHVVTGQIPPCPLCGASGKNMIQKPTRPNAKWECLAAKCGAKFLATWIPDATPQAEGAAEDAAGGVE